VADQVAALGIHRKLHLEFSQSLLVGYAHHFVGKCFKLHKADIHPGKRYTGYNYCQLLTGQQTHYLTVAFSYSPIFVLSVSLADEAMTKTVPGQ
jgi:hypothetical protein